MRVRFLARFSIVLVTWAALPLLLPTFISATPAHAQRAPLTIGEIKSLLLIGGEDSKLAQQIEERGLAFDVTNDVLRQMSQNGAGNQTLEALRRHVAPPVLLIQTDPPGSEVVVDGKRLATTDPSGSARIRSLAAGSHEILVRKNGYRDATRTVRLRAGEQVTTAIKLEPAPARLKVRSQIPGASARIEQLGRPLVPGSEIELEPGDYDLVASCPVCESTVTRVRLGPGEGREIDLELEIDASSVDGVAARLADMLSRDDVENARPLAEVLVALRPQEPLGWQALAEGYFITDDRENFSRAARSALEHGATLHLPVRHRDDKLSPDLEDSVLVVSSTSLGFEPFHHGCRIGAVAYPASGLLRATIDNDPDFLWLLLTFPGPDGKKPFELRIADRESYLEPALKNRAIGGVLNVRYRGNVMIRRRLASQSLYEIKALLEALGR